MTKLQLEFVSQRRIPWFGLTFLSVTLIWSAFVAVKWIDLRNRNQQSQAQVLELERLLKEKNAKAQQVRLAMDPAMERHANEQKKVLKALTYSWNQVFAAIEQAASDNVAILSFTHDQATSDSQLSVEALDVAALVRFVEKLNEADPDKRWYIASYQMQPQNSPQTVRGIILFK